MEVSGPGLATWLVYRAEQTSSPNILDFDLKAVKSFRQAAKKPFLDFYIADATLRGLLKKMEAKPLTHLGLEPEIVQVLIHNTITEN